MILAGGRFQVFVATRPVDFRKGMDSLAAVVQERIRLDPFSGAVPDQQMVKLDQRCLHHARGPERHAGAGGGIQDPCRGHDDDARRRLEVDNRAGYTLLAALIPDTTPIEGVPAIVDLDLLPDMGRMAARSRWAARTVSSGGRRRSSRRDCLLRSSKPRP